MGAVDEPSRGSVLGAFTELPVDELSLCLWCCAFTELPAAAMVCLVLSPSCQHLCSDLYLCCSCAKTLGPRPMMPSTASSSCTQDDVVQPLIPASLKLKIICVWSSVATSWGEAKSFIIIPGGLWARLPVLRFKVWQCRSGPSAKAWPAARTAHSATGRGQSKG